MQTRPGTIEEDEYTEIVGDYFFDILILKISYKEFWKRMSCHYIIRSPYYFILCNFVPFLNFTKYYDPSKYWFSDFQPKIISPKSVRW